jgi:predicted RNA methylase
VGNLRYRNARDAADLLGQVFTPYPIAALLATSVSVGSQPVRNILDLGAGMGMLTTAILDQNVHAKALLVEIDEMYASALRKMMPAGTKVVNADAVSGNWECQEVPDVIVSNPPYGTMIASQELQDKLFLAGIRLPISGNWLRSEVAFVALAWNIAQIKTKLGLIIASPMICNKAYQPLRERFVNGLSGLCVTQLHEATFQNAEVRAFMVTGRRAVNRRRNVILRKALADGSITDEMSVDYSAAVMSLDIDYHRCFERLGITASNDMETLESIGTTIVRGSRSQKDYGRLGLNAFHTSNFSHSLEEVVLCGASEKFQVARSGDILIPRVGSRCLTRQAKVRDGVGLFTDCVYRLNIKPTERDRVWNTLTSSFGCDWRLANAGGSCAKHLTVQTLQGMPLLK